MNTETHANGRTGFLLLAGMAIGSALGMLFAPRTGAEIRRNLRESTERGRHALSQRGQQLSQSARDAVNKGKDFVQRQREHLSGAVEAGKQAYREEKKSHNGESTGGI